MPMKLTAFLLLAGLVTACGRSEPPPAPVDPLRVLSSNGVKAVVETLQPDIERTIGRPLTIEFSTAAGLKQRIEKGAAFDVAILTPAILHDLAAQKLIVAESQIGIARTGVGIGARAGAPRADVSTPEALKALLLNAKSVTFTEAGQSRGMIDAAYKRLGIEEEMKAKSILKGPGESPEAVARGEAELVLTLVSEIVPVKGVQLLGPLPTGLQGYVSFAGARSPAARDASAADAMLRYLSGPSAASALAANGMEAVEQSRF
jgi:molybdate transport system substrate-binding protein